VASMDYPRHQILVLDDSTDDTRQIVDASVRRWAARGADIAVVRRPTRVGYKAGALDHAMPRSRGRFIAMFDSDFVPPRDFPRRSVPGPAARPDVGCLQGRWDHLNRANSWMTRAQGLAIDGHFMIEQPARSAAGVFLNFNGTAGLWRREVIEHPAV